MSAKGRSYWIKAINVISHGMRLWANDQFNGAENRRSRLIEAKKIPGLEAGNDWQHYRIGDELTLPNHGSYLNWQIVQLHLDEELPRVVVSPIGYSMRRSIYVYPGDDRRNEKSYAQHYRAPKQKCELHPEYIKYEITRNEAEDDWVKKAAQRIIDANRQQVANRLYEIEDEIYLPHHDNVQWWKIISVDLDHVRPRVYLNPTSGQTTYNGSLLYVGEDHLNSPHYKDHVHYPQKSNPRQEEAPMNELASEAPQPPLETVVDDGLTVIAHATATVVCQTDQEAREFKAAFVEFMKSYQALNAERPKPWTTSRVQLSRS